MARRLTVDEYTNKLVNNASNASEDYRSGVNSVTTSPTAAAAKALDKAKTNYIEAINSGRMAKKLNEVSLEQWKELTAGKGGDRYASGVTAAKEKIRKFAEKLIPYVYNVSETIAKMPSTTKEDMKQRMLKNFDMMSNFSA